MDEVKKLRRTRRKVMLRLLLSMLTGKMGYDRAEILRKSNLFHSFGEKVYFHPYKIPTEPMGISIGNNVVICAGVEFITHDVIHRMLNNNIRYSNVSPGGDLIT